MCVHSCTELCSGQYGVPICIYSGYQSRVKTAKGSQVRFGSNLPESTENARACASKERQHMSVWLCGDRGVQTTNYGRKVNGAHVCVCCTKDVNTKGREKMMPLRK
jgi:hypothetical protein